MNRLYLFLPIFIGFTLSGCAAMSTENPTPAKKVTSEQATVPTAPTQDTLPKSATTEQKKPKQCPYEKKPPKSPMAVLVYPKGMQLNHPYKIIAKESIAKYNQGGIKRQDAIIHDTLRTLAASVGGDAVINVTHEKSRVVGTVVKFDEDQLT